MLEIEQLISQSEQSLLESEDEDSDVQEVEIKDLTVSLRESLGSKGLKLAVTVRIDQKLNTIVMKNGRKILKFNVADKSGDLIECICYNETHD